MKKLRNVALRRVLGLLDLLSNGQIHTRRDLAIRMGVSQRTVRRDVDILNEVGFDIYDDVVSTESTADIAAYQLPRTRTARELLALRRAG